MPRDNPLSAPREARPRVHQAGDTAIAIDDIASIAKEAGDVIMKIYNGTSAEVGRGRTVVGMARRSLAALTLPIALSRRASVSRAAHRSLARDRIGRRSPTSRPTAAR